MRRAVVLLAVLAALVALPAGGADAPARGRIPTVTRLVKLFLELEQALGASLASGDAAAAGTLLVDDFELRPGYAPGTPTPRAEWLRRSLSAPSPYEIEQMAVHDYGDVAVVSFLQAAAPGGRRDPTLDLVTVDVWKRTGDAWKLAVRYSGPAGDRTFAIPGASTEPAMPKRY